MASNEASGTATKVDFNPRFLTQPTGVLRIAEISFGLLCWTLTAGFSAFNGPLQFVMFVAVMSWILTIVLLIIYLFALNTTTFSSWPWTIIDLGFNGFWGLFYFIASCVLAANTGAWIHLVAATVFAFLTTAAYVIQTVFAFMEWRGTPFGRAASSGTPVDT